MASNIARTASPNSEDCNNIHMGDSDDEGPAARSVVARSEDTISVPVTGAPLHVIAAKNGGVKVRGGTAGNFKVTVCKVARAASQQAAQQLLGQVHLENSGNSLQPVGPEGEGWVAFLIIEAPANAAMEVEAVNGPISFRDMSGTVKAQAKNGPISFRGMSGDVDATVQNGPVSFDGSSGNIKLNAHNGPLSVKLEGSNWSGTGLQAETVNGPLSISLPADYESGVEINTSGYSPVSCKAKGCDASQRVENGRVRRITFGSGNPLVHIATRNGPVMVDNSHAKY
ncbi:MAG: hypothetical protein ABI383_01905 [Acidobacteriaceae bacterium]